MSVPTAKPVQLGETCRCGDPAIHAFLSSFTGERHVICSFCQRWLGEGIIAFLFLHGVAVRNQQEAVGAA